MKDYPHPSPDEQRLERRSRAYHEHPSHAEDCSTYEEFHGRRCPCESYRIQKNPRPVSTGEEVNR